MSSQLPVFQSHPEEPPIDVSSNAFIRNGERYMRADGRSLMRLTVDRWIPFSGVRRETPKNDADEISSNQR